MKYTSILATEEHSKVTTVKQLKGQWCKLGLHLDGKGIGMGELRYQSAINVHTDGTEIFKKFRRKGHGIHLYLHLIKAAKKIGARRIYSGRNLNKFSRKMWHVKLRQYFQVHRIGGCKQCGCGARFFINL
jgi:hypothetical protein